MYRLFSMLGDGRLFQLSGRGWVRRDGTNFGSVQQVRGFVEGRPVPVLPNTVDAYIGQVTANGSIITTHPILEDCNESIS